MSNNSPENTSKKPKSEPPISRTRVVMRDVIARSLRQIEAEEFKRGEQSKRAHRRRRRRHGESGDPFASTMGSMVADGTMRGTQQSSRGRKRSPMRRQATAAKVSLRSIGSLGADAMLASIGGHDVETSPIRSRKGSRPTDSREQVRDIANSRNNLPDDAIVPPRVATLVPESQPVLSPHDIRALWDGFAPVPSLGREAMDPTIPFGRPGPRGSVLDIDDPHTTTFPSPRPPSPKPRRSSVQRARTRQESRAEIRARLTGTRKLPKDDEIAALIRKLHAQEKKMYERVVVG